MHRKTKTAQARANMAARQLDKALQKEVKVLGVANEEKYPRFEELLPGDYNLEIR